MLGHRGFWGLGVGDEELRLYKLEGATPTHLRKIGWRACFVSLGQAYESANSKRRTAGRATELAGRLLQLHLDPVCFGTGAETIKKLSHCSERGPDFPCLERGILCITKDISLRVQLPKRQVDLPQTQSRFETQKNLQSSCLGTWNPTELRHATDPFPGL